MSRNKSDPVVEFLDLVAELAARMYWHRWQQESSEKKTSQGKQIRCAPSSSREQIGKRLPDRAERRKRSQDGTGR